MIANFKWIAATGSIAGLLLASPALATCRVTDFTDQPLASLNEMQRLSFVSQLERTEFDRLKPKPQGDPNHDPIIAAAASAVDARKAAWAKLDSLKIDNIDDYRRVWRSDFLTDEGLRKYTDCITARAPGLVLAGRPEGPALFHLTYSHLTPIGVEKIATRVIATYNIANVGELEASLDELGMQDNYKARTLPLRIVDPAKRAVVVMRAGWETPVFLYIPVYPATDHAKAHGH
jgi:hypothetical protein